MFYEYYRLREVAEGEDVLYGHHFVASVERAGDKSGCHVERIYYPPYAIFLDSALAVAAWRWLVFFIFYDYPPLPRMFLRHVC